MRTFLVLLMIAASLPAETLRRCMPPADAASRKVGTHGSLEEWKELAVFFPHQDVNVMLSVSPDCEISWRPANVDPYRLYSDLWELIFAPNHSKAPDLHKTGTSPRQAIRVLIHNWLEGQESLNLSQAQLNLLRFAPHRVGHCAIYDGMMLAAECDIPEKK